MTATVSRNFTRFAPRDKKTRALRTSFLLGCGTALALFLPFLIIDKGFFLYAGDYNLQQIPFYMYVNQFIKQGGGTWSWATDMGSSIVYSYSFYNLGSPFLWLSLIFPHRWMPYMMVPLFCVKFGCIAAVANLYLSRYARTRSGCLTVSLIYAFCGFNIYNIFFNHMLEPVVLFPLIMWGMDELVYENKRGRFALAIGLALLDSYFFFVGNVVFALIYFFIKLLRREYIISGARFLTLIFEALIGVGIGMVIALPSAISLMQNPRVENFSYGYYMLFYDRVTRYFAIFSSMFVPPDPPYLPNMYPEGGIKWTSLSFFLPLVSMVGVISYLKARKKTATGAIFITCLVMAFVPFLNSSFIAFNASYYARWFYMPILMACLMTLRALEDSDIDLKPGFKWTFILTGVHAIFGLVPNKDAEGNWTLGITEIPAKLWLTVFTALLGVFVFYIIVRYFRTHPRYASILLAGVMCFSLFYGVIHMALTKVPQLGNDANFKNYAYDSAVELPFPEDNGFYRIDSFEAPDNYGLWSDQSSLHTFNSTVSPTIMEFYPLVGVKRDVSSKPDHSLFAIRGMLHVRYMVLPKTSAYNFENQGVGGAGWSPYATGGDMILYENDNFVPLGFTYNQYITSEQLNLMTPAARSEAMMQAIHLFDEGVAEYGHLFTGGQLYANDVEYGYNNYVQHCNDRRAVSSYYTDRSNSGFTVKIDLPRENLVYFGVPYEEGWSATVNGQPATVVKVNCGMMAVLAPAGDNTIVFTYRTPGLRTGTVITLTSLLVLGAYVALTPVVQRKLRQEKAAKAAARAAGKASTANGERQNSPRAGNTHTPRRVPGSADSPNADSGEAPSAKSPGETGPPASDKDVTENPAEDSPAGQ